MSSNVSAASPTGRIEIASQSSGQTPPIDRKLMLVSISVMLGMIMAIIDTTIVNVALAQIGGNLGASIDEVGWVATGYLLSAVIVMPLNGWLTARLGRRNYYAASVAIFTIASMLCGTATSIWQLVAYRMIQGIGGGALQPTAQAILFESFPAEKRGQGMALFGLGAMVGPAIGPLLGGYLVSNYEWPLIFFINLPIGIIAFFMTLAFIEDPPYIKKHAQPLDYLGLGFLVIGLASLQYVLERGQHDDWFNSGLIVTLTAASVFGLVAFVWRQLSESQPLVDLRVFANRTFAAGNFIGIITGFGLFGLSLVLPLFMQTLLGWDAWQSGLGLLPGAIATAVSMIVVGQLSGRVDNRLLMTFGLVVFALSTWQMSFLTQAAGYWDVFWPRFWQGFALGPLFVPLSVVTIAALRRDQIANATGIGTLLRQLGGSLGIAILTTYLQHDTTRAYAMIGQEINAGRSVVEQSISAAEAPFLAQGMTATAARQMAMVQISEQAQTDATTIAYEDLFKLSAFLFVVTIPSVLLISRRPGTGRNAPSDAPIPAAE
jgi:DHA2 family multidrug resistance protein